MHGTNRPRVDFFCFSSCGIKSLCWFLKELDWKHRLRASVHAVEALDWLSLYCVTPPSSFSTLLRGRNVNTPSNHCLFIYSNPT
ncbi:hypothetical protein BRADI_3g19005v3 [Brachypodium distachyon]|uniref:Uncharacterized protein n=1 Tax=Brachypodium distachyon TaxID=15368 RepID=A0A2K2CY70_BRADI|nr:hypothetical protein BRADI_3g19005v3 [Brachypodium distachyon]